MSPHSNELLNVALDDLAMRLTTRGVTIGGAAPSRQQLIDLFDTSLGKKTSVERLRPLERRYCEEHLAGALTAAKAAIQERMTYYQAGERYASLLVSIATDQRNVDLLAEEAQALALRRATTEAGIAAETEYSNAAAAHKQSFGSYVAQTDPTAQPALGDAMRQFWLSYLARGITVGAAKLNPSWWTEGYRVDASWGPPDSGNDDTRKINIATPVVDSEAWLAKRHALAGFRLSHARAVADAASVEAMGVASAGRLVVLSKTEAYDRAVEALAANRQQSAAAIVDLKQELTRYASLFGFEAQMRLAVSRCWDLAVEAVERAAAAYDGLKAIYGFDPGAPPAVESLDALESLLFWCRRVARLFLGLQDVTVSDTLRLSLRKILGSNWKTSVNAGAAIDLSHYSDLGAVVRLRDVAVKLEGAGAPKDTTRLTPPLTVTDSTYLGEKRTGVGQPSVKLSIAPQPLSSEVQRQNFGRAVHNLAIAGEWNVKHPSADLVNVDDLVVELKVSYLTVALNG